MHGIFDSLIRVRRHHIEVEWQSFSSNFSSKFRFVHRQFHSVDLCVFRLVHIIFAIFFRRRHFKQRNFVLSQRLFAELRMLPDMSMVRLSV